MTKGFEADFFAEVFVGRVPLDNPEKLEHFVNKTVSYLNFGVGYLPRCLMAAEYLADPYPPWSSQFGGDYMDELIDGSSAHGYTTAGVPSDQFDIATLYDRDWPTFDPDDPWNTGWSKSEILNSLSFSFDINV